MRSNISFILAALLAFIAVLVAAAEDAVPGAPPPDRKEAVSSDDSPKATEFNGIKVPPVLELTADNFRETISHDYWLVKAFSPYCQHCRHLAPKWQTIYEFYYTSDPVPASSQPKDDISDLNSFTRFYNFHFATLDCIAYQDMCVELDATSWPSLVLYKDGKEIKKMVGDKTMEKLSGFVEEALESIKPGSRPVDGVHVPKVGAKGTDLGSSSGKSKVPVPAKEPAKATVNKPSQAIPLDNAAINPDGRSMELDVQSFNENVKESLHPWFIKFYAPWCHHCQAMAPAWETMAREMHGKLNIGEVNCEEQKKLCRMNGVNAYPTIKFFRGPESYDYNGLRGLGDLVDWAKQAAVAVSGVPDLTLAEFEKMEQTEEVIFIYFYDHATTSEDLMALERLPIHTIGHAKVVKTQDPDMVKRFRVSTWPRLLVSRDGQVSVYEKLMPNQMRDVKALVGWMQANWLPLVPELTSANAQDVTKGKFAVLAILTRERVEEFAAARKEIKEAAIEWSEKQAQAFKAERQQLRDAKQLKIEAAEERRDVNAVRDAKLIKIDMDEIKRKEVSFAWVDGVFWERWVRTTFGVSPREDGERVIVYDVDVCIPHQCSWTKRLTNGFWQNRRYWDESATGGPISASRAAILETLPKIVVSPSKLSAKRTGSFIAYFFWRVKQAFVTHPLLSCGVLLGAGATYVVGMRWIRRRRGGYMAGNGSGLFDSPDSKDGLLGHGASNGKAD